jgi:homoserine dehydrogenase
VSAPLKVAIAGLGTVGVGTLTLLRAQTALLTQLAGRAIRVTAVSSRDRDKDRGVSLDGLTWYDDAAKMASEADCDVVIEVIGGAGGMARATCEAALRHGRHLVTANKALLAVEGANLAAIAESKNLGFGFEAAVAGGIPIIKAIREGLAANKLSQVTGIMNGTCNYILTTMRESKRDFAEVLKEAQELGYAETDPSFDIDGIDTAHKLAILTSLAFGTKVDFEAIHIEGIRHISALDIRFAEELGYRIKLLGIARRTHAGIEQRVHPCMVPINSSIGRVEGVFKAVVAEGDYVGRTQFEGRGAGAGPTASAIVADLVDIAKGRIAPAFGIKAAELTTLVPVPMGDNRGAYYVRLMVLDRHGVFADIAAALRDEEVSMEAVLQHGRAPGETVPVVLTVHSTREASMNRALARIAGMDAMVEPPRLIRIENF